MPLLDQGINSRAVDNYFWEAGPSQVADPLSHYVPRVRQADAKPLQMVPLPPRPAKKSLCCYINKLCTYTGVVV